MENFTGKNIVQKILIVLVIVITFNFAIPKPVNADMGGILMSPVVSLVTSLLDGIQRGLETFILGSSSAIMKDPDDDALQDKGQGDSGIRITVDEQLDGAFLGFGDIKVAKVRYTPEEIFSNRVPALDVNFIKPSVNAKDNSRNIAVQLQDLIASWYVAIRMLAIVGLLSVLVYLGIRMLITSIAADRAKYKKMIMDWLVAMCLIFVLHYIMSFALTMAETVTAMISSDLGKTIHVSAPSEGISFYGNLMSYVRFMIQCADLEQKIGFFFVYLMLVIYSIRFTWIYLKRVVNMAFLTLIAPIVAFTYPIDKVGDGQAQAFNMWVKEFSFNALIQPLHLLIYTILVGSAVQLATDNPLYAIVCLGFIIAAEKILKQMFGFNKASGGTVGSLAGAAGVTMLASQALNNFAKKGPNGGGNGGGGNKVRTKDTERTTKNSGANSGLDSFNREDAQGIPSVGGSSSPESENERGGAGQARSGEQDSGAGLPNANQEPDLDSFGGLDGRDNYGDAFRATEEGASSGRPPSGGGDDSQGAGVPPPPDTFTGKVGQDISRLGSAMGRGYNNVKTGARNIGKGAVRTISGAKKFATDKNFRNKVGTIAKGKAKSGLTGLNKLAGRGYDGAKRNIKAGIRTLPTVGYKAARGTLRTAARIGTGAALAATAGVIGATTGDGDKAMSMAMGAGAIGLATGDNLFDATVGRVMKDTSIRDTFEAEKYGNKIDARNARADKEFLKSQEFEDYYEKHFKNGSNKKTKKEVKETFKQYREAGITDKDTIRKGMALEAEYAKSTGRNASDFRGQVQNIIQTKDDIDKKAFSDKKVRETEIKKLESVLTNVSDPQRRRQTAESIFKGYEDFRRISL